MLLKIAGQLMKPRSENPIVKFYPALITSLMISFPAAAQVLPQQAGEYTGTFKARTVTTDSSLDERTKSSIVCSIQPDGSTEITSDDGMLINGNLVSGEKYGFFSISNLFVTGTGLWKFKSRGNV